MATVWRAWDDRREQEVALKVCSPSFPEYQRILKAEFRRVAELVHPNLVALHELFASERLTGFTMEWARRRALRR